MGSNKNKHQEDPETKKIYSYWRFDNVGKIISKSGSSLPADNINFVGAKDALKIRGSLARADLPVPEFFSRNKAQIPLGSGLLQGGGWKIQIVLEWYSSGILS